MEAAGRVSCHDITLIVPVAEQAMPRKVQITSGGTKAIQTESAAA